MPELPPDLEGAVQRLYSAFSGLRPRAELRTDFCRHCVSAEEAEMLMATPLRDISADLMRRFMWEALAWIWGTPHDLAYYLPRILELLATGQFSNIHITSLFGRLPWRDWQPDQQAAVTGYLSALWQATITGYWSPGTLGARDVLEAAGDLGIPVEPYLYAWEVNGSEAAALHLAHLIRYGLARRGAALDTGWEQAIERWIAGPAPRGVIAAALASASTPETAANLSGTLKILEDRAH